MRVISKKILRSFGKGILTVDNNYSLGTKKLIMRIGKVREIFKKMNVKPIKNKKDYQLALNRLESIFDAKRGTPEVDRPQK